MIQKLHFSVQHESEREICVFYFFPQKVCCVMMAYGFCWRARINVNTAVKVRGSLLCATGVPLTCL